MERTEMKKNVYINFTSNILLMLLGIIVPRVFISSYGSDVNGLLSTLTQIFTYLGLMESGIGQAAKNAMYGPLANHDYDEVSHVSSIAARYYRRVAVYYGIGVCVLSLICPYILKTEVDHLTVFLVIVIEGATKVIVYYFNSFYGYFLAANGKSYINNEVNVVNSVLAYVAKIGLAMAGINIVVLQIVYFCISIGLVFFYRYYFRKNYSWLKLDYSSTGEKLKDRGSYLIESVSWLAFSSTDMIVLSTFVSTVLSSIYAVYTMVFNCLNTMVNSVYVGINYVLGKTFHEDIDKYKILHDSYTSFFLGAITILLCTAYELILPFMSLYIGDVSDTQYVLPSLPVLFCLVQLISWSRYVMGNLAGLAGYQKQQGYVSIVEALVNILLSIMLVQKYNITGVLFASVVALPIKVVYLTWICEKKILHRNPVKYVLIMSVNYAFFALTVFINKFIHLQIDNYLSFCLHGIVILLINCAIGLLINIAANPKCIKTIKQILFK